MFAKLWNDEAGFIISAELVLIATILVLGLIAGLASTRDAVITELADVGGAFGNLTQTFTFGGAAAHCSTAPGSAFVDSIDFGDASGTAGTNSRCLVVCVGVGGTSAEGTAS